ncbi:MAG: hypothetical protein RLZZ127_1375 [Planctomycetota bacterium]|jgi:hypothetical protein
MHATLVLLLVMIAGVLAAVPAVAAEIVLDDGRRIAGELVPGGPDEVRIRVPLGSGPAELAFPTARVVRIDHAAGSEAAGRLALQREIDALPADTGVDGWMAAAARARVAGMGGLARRCAEEALRRDRHREDAARIAGLVRHRGVWMRPAEAATARGQVWHGGRWVDVPERDRQVEEARRQAVAQAEAARALAERMAAPVPAPASSTVLVIERTVAVPAWTTPRTCWWDRPTVWRPRSDPHQGSSGVIVGRQDWSQGGVTWSARW